MFRKLIFALILGGAFHGASYSKDYKDYIGDLVDQAQSIYQTRTVTAPSSRETEVAFSPGRGAEELVLKSINSATSSIRVAAYSFTSSTVVNALIAAKRRGVDIGVIVDYKNNFVDGCGSGGACKGRHAVATLINAGIPVKTISKYQIFHNKFICIDGKHLETGSFNYSRAALSNAENVVVMWNAPEIVQLYGAKWMGYWNEAQQPPL